MLASILIIVVSLVLLIYWFRYACLLLLTSRSEDAQAIRVAEANRLGFPAVRDELKAELGRLSMERLRGSLDRDYQILLYLLRYSAGPSVVSIEEKMLLMDYRIMRLWYRVVRDSSSERARAALQEMSNVLAFLADEMAARTEASS